MFFAGAILAGREWPSLRNTLLIIAAAAGARTVALALNRIIDREIDKRNPRTKDRHLASGSMNLVEAWLVALMGLGVYLGAAWLLSEFCFRWSWVPIMAFGAYPFFKRFTQWTHVGLGFVWALVPLAGYFAIKPSMDGISSAIMLGVFSIFWLAGFDIIYATLDEEYDRQAGLYSLPARWGSRAALRMAAVFHALAFLILLLMYGFWLEGGPITVMLLVVSGLLLFLEQRYSNYVDFAFFHMNVAIGFVVFLFVMAGTNGV